MFSKQFVNKQHLFNDSGLSLIEVMIALAIFTIGILAISSMRISVIQSNTHAAMHTEAVVLASDRIEQLMAAAYDDGNLSAGAIDAPEAHPPISSPPYTVTWTVTAIDLDGDTDEDMKTVNVNVSWSQAGKGRTRNVSFGCSKAKP